MSVDMTGNIFPDYIKACAIIEHAFRKDMKERNVNYTVKINPKQTYKMEIEFDF